MIPLRDVIPSRTTPYITVTIIVLNALAWLYELMLPHELLTDFLSVYGVVPADLALPTLITSMFLHGSWSHVIGNMWYLWIFGDNVEDRVGHGRFIIFYLLCGIAAGLGQVVVDPNSTLPTIGASGAIAGVLAAYIVLFGARPVRVLMSGYLTNVPSYVMIGLWFVTQLVSGFGGQSDGVAYWAHIGGFIAGLVLTFLLRGFTRTRAAGAPAASRRSLLR